MYDTATSLPEESDSPSATVEESRATKPKKKERKCTCKGFSSKDVLKAEKNKKIEGSPWFRQQKYWENYIKKHAKDLKNVKPVVDDKPPKLNITNMYDVELLTGVWNALKGTYECNIQMVKRLHEVNVLPGKTDTFKFNYNKPRFTNYSGRKSEAKEIEKKNIFLLHLINSPETRMTTAKQYAKEWKKIESLIETSSQFPLFWKVKKDEKPTIEVAPPVPYFQQYVTEKSAKYSNKRPRVFLEVAIKNVGVVGKMIAMLYSDYVPMTVKNFLTFCNPRSKLTYKGNSFYLIFQNYYCQTGDVVENRGYGGTSIYGPYFGNEDLTLKHGQRGVLTMYNKIPKRNGSQFLITFKKLESLDGTNVVFGKIIKGFHVLDAIEALGSKKTGRPRVNIFISDCDEI